MIIWYPTLNNIEHFVNIKTKTLQSICESKDELKEVLDQIKANVDVQFFVVKYDKNDWDYYEEIVVFSHKTIDEFKDNYTANISQLDYVNRTVPDYEGERNLCCEIRFDGINKETKVSEIIGEARLSENNVEPGVTNDEIIFV